MKSIYILLSNTGSFTNRAIKTFTSAPYNHASLALDKSMKRIYSFGRRKPTNPFWGGFVQEDFVEGTFSWYPYATCAVYEYTLSRRNYQKLERLVKTFARNYKTYFYNYAGLLGVPINQPIEVPASYFCSQFVSEVLDRSGSPLFSKASSLVTPDDFRYHEDLKLIYEGPLYEYPFLYSTPFYHPKRYQSFPFRKYLKQQVKAEVLGIYEERGQIYQFRDGFIKPKKILLSKKWFKLKQLFSWKKK
ncbi:hypothetical protein [Halobacillus sp. BBL2006]|uniref:hypothetical protein n=1 Tax=Halobacillus sp. BBL2006 TaxID=1543706 RepID=UPI000AFE23BB|nr:hypothetical protein [Halobacillus sp. BBL2006]